MLIITGIGRCGTSLVAKFVKEMGIDVGNVHWNSEINAGMEDADIVWINRNLYLCHQRYGSSSKFLLKAHKSIEKCKLEVIKDPRFTWPGVLDAWIKIRNDIKVLIMFRNFEDIIKSRLSMGKNSNDLIDVRPYTVERVQRDFAQFFNIIMIKNISYKILLFPEILDKQINLVQALSDLGVNIRIMKGLSILESIVNKNLVHKF